MERSSSITTLPSQTSSISRYPSTIVGPHCTLNQDHCQKLSTSILVCLLKRQCLNGASNLGIQHLSTLSKVEVKIRSNRNKDSNYDLAENMDDSASKYVVSAIKTAIETLPNRPTIRFNIEVDYRYCKHCKFEFVSLLQNFKYQCFQ